MGGAGGVGTLAQRVRTRDDEKIIETHREKIAATSQLDSAFPS